jgi:hypothetical protein
VGGGSDGGGGGGPIDADGDGVAAPFDCDDNDDTVSPNEQEGCNGRDDDCDGQIDEDGPGGDKTLYSDADNDGFGDPNTAKTKHACEQLLGYVANDDDCNDVRNDVNPDKGEVEGDGVDNDCDSSTYDDPNYDSGFGMVPNALSGLLLAGWMGASAWRRRRRRA